MAEEKTIGAVPTLATIAVLLIITAVVAVKYESVLFPVHSMSKGEYKLDIAIRMVDHNPNDEQARINLGWLYYNAGNYTDAIKEFEAAIKLDTGNPVAYYNLGLAYIELGQLKVAEEQLQKSLQYSRHPDLVFIALGEINFRQEEYEDAILYYEEALRWIPNMPEIHMMLAKAYEESGNIEKARENYESAAAYAPDLQAEIKKKLRRLK
ncbi:MAG: tetratricopeptide repeat protein [Bacillota bacterium]|nr:tetratricopeptide repeat protein [Bacillota bacterium]MDW7685317.1 tetratricopeptide repeat protein [Bacillota bacterium]